MTAKPEEKSTKRIVNLVCWDWKESPELVSMLKPFGIHVYEDPSCEGSDTYGYILSNEPLTKEELKKISGVEEEEEEEPFLDAGAPGLTYKGVRDALDKAMGENWEEKEMQHLLARLKSRFPRHHKTLDRIMEWAGDNSNERSDIETHSGGNEEAYDKCWKKVMRAVERLPWE